MTTSEEATITPAQVKELMDRMRRMETRMVKFMEAQGFITDVQRPYLRVEGLDHNVIMVPSTALSLRDLVETMKNGNVIHASVQIGSEHICRVDL